MQFIRRVRAAWTYLPAFRAVAETEHLPTAARELDLVPSSLSRSIKLLEESLGVELFDHGGKTLVLNNAGRTLLGAVRDAMRVLDDALRSLAGDDMTGRVTLAITEDLPSALVAQLCSRLHAAHPELEISICATSDAAVDSLLLRGAVDVAIVGRVARDGDLEVRALRSRERAVFATAVPDGPYRCVVVGAPTRPSDDGWPLEVPRQISMWVNDEIVALEVALSSGLAVVATEDAVVRYGDRFVRLDVAGVRPRSLALVHRRTLGSHPRTAALTAACCAAFER